MKHLSVRKFRCIITYFFLKQTPMLLVVCVYMCNFSLADSKKRKLRAIGSSLYSLCGLGLCECVSCSDHGWVEGQAHDEPNCVCVFMHISFAFTSYERGRFKNATSSQQHRPKYVCVSEYVCVCVYVHIDFPTRLFTVIVKLWWERARKKERERGGRYKTLSIWPSGEPARTKKHTHTHTKAQTHRWKQCYFLVLFYSHSAVNLTNQHPDNSSTHTHTHRYSFR